MRNCVLIIAALATISGCATIQKINPFSSAAFHKFDSNGDGVIDRHEAKSDPALAQNFNRIDTNQSGGIDPAEYGAANAHIANVDFKKVDINGDGVISKREAAAMPASVKQDFDTVDSDGDGNVSPTEYQAATVNLLKGAKFGELDRDGDGVIDTKEAEKNPALAANYDRIDTDGDGLVNRAEFKAAQQ